MNAIVPPKSLAALGLNLPPIRAAASPSSVLRPQSSFPNWLTPAAAPRWIGRTLAQWTPQQVEYCFRAALGGDLVSQWEMFDLMEATWPRLSKNLNELKDSVCAMDWDIVPWAAREEEPSEEAMRRASVIEDALYSMRPDPAKDENDFEDSLRDLMDARGKGISVLEWDFEYRDLGGVSALAPRCSRWVHPSFYGYDGDTLKLRLTPDNPTQYNRGGYLEFPPDRFTIGVSKNKTGHPCGAAMLHVLGFWWAAANFSAEWFLNFAQIFGQPIRWATCDANIAPGDRTKLEAMLANMGSAAWALFPPGVTLEIKEAAKGAGDNPQAALLAMADKVCDLVILRQTLTSDVGDSGSRALGDVHERVLTGVQMACAKWVSKTLAPLIRTLCIANFGDDTECPWLKPCKEEEDESPATAALLAQLSAAGLEPTDEALPALSEKLGFPIQRKAPVAPPNPFGGFTRAPSAETPEPPESEPETEEAEKPADPEEESDPAEVAQVKARAAQSSVAYDLGVPATWLNPIAEFFRDLVKQAGSGDSPEATLAAVEAAAKRLPELFGKMDTEALAKVFEAGMAKAVIAGARESVAKL
jgi:phage gp29-like protein